MSIVVAHHDPFIANKVAHELRAHFVRVAVATNTAELPRTLQHHKARVAVLDLELVCVDEVQKLCRTFPDLNIVCTHRSPDLRMWMAALDAGAVEFCHPEDTPVIVRASRKIVRHQMAVIA